MIDSAKLQQFYEAIIHDQMCIKIYCTTCGAEPFRREFARLAGYSGTIEKHLPLESKLALEFVDSLAELSVPMAEPVQFEYITWTLIEALLPSIGREEMARRLMDSPAASVFSRMLAKWTADEERRKKAPPQIAPWDVDAYRAERKRERAERHADRLEQKKIRDAEWWSMQCQDKGRQ